MFEDRVFDISDLDHPGGRFITRTLRGKEVSRWLVGGFEYSQLPNGASASHRHSPFALNMLEERYGPIDEGSSGSFGCRNCSSDTN